MQPVLLTDRLILRPLPLGSRRISERTGMRLIRTEKGKFVEGSFPKDIWEMPRDEWLKSKSPSQ